MNNPVEIQPPDGDYVLIAPCVENSRGHVSFALFDNVPLDFCHSPAVESLVSESLNVVITGSTYAVNCPIASNTDLLSSSIRLPSVKGCTDISASQPQVDIVGLVGQRVLAHVGLRFVIAEWGLTYPDHC